MTSGALPEAGWYPDPAQPGFLRWWNGQEWSTTVHPIPTNEPITRPNPFPELESSVAVDTRRRTWPAIAIAGLLIVVIIGALIALAAAFNRSNLDTDALASRISTELTQKFNMSISVTCPPHVPVAQGTTFECTASDQQGAQRTVVVTQTSDSGDVSYVLGS